MLKIRFLLNFLHLISVVQDGNENYEGIDDLNLNCISFIVDESFEDASKNLIILCAKILHQLLWEIVLGQNLFIKGVVLRKLG
jgi:hypothetical protein